MLKLEHCIIILKHADYGKAKHVKQQANVHYDVRVKYTFQLMYARHTERKFKIVKMSRSKHDCCRKIFSSTD